jgi:hypothetical protein
MLMAGQMTSCARDVAHLRAMQTSPKADKLQHDEGQVGRRSDGEELIVGSVGAARL